MIDMLKIFEQIEAAARAERKMQPVTVRNVFCNWPEIIRSFYEAYGQTAATAKVNLTSRQITEYNQVIVWLGWLPKLDQQILWARANGFSWREIAAQAGKSDKTCKQMAQDSVLCIYIKHNRIRIPIKIEQKPLPEKRSRVRIYQTSQEPDFCS